jgi:hypothetical protein
MYSSIQIFNIPEINFIILQYKKDIDDIYNIILLIDEIILNYTKI